MSLDGFIAGVDGGYEWIVDEPTIDFAKYLEHIDTLLMGRATYETAMAEPQSAALLGSKSVYVVSTTLAPADHPDVTVISKDVAKRIAALKRKRRGKDIWLFGGGVLFRSMLEAGLVDRVEVGVVPVLLGVGIPVLPGVLQYKKLDLHSQEAFPSGILLLKYDVVND